MARYTNYSVGELMELDDDEFEFWRDTVERYKMPSTWDSETRILRAPEATIYDIINLMKAATTGTDTGTETKAQPPASATPKFRPLK